MADPLTALVTAGLILAVLAIVFWPEKGLAARLMQWRRSSQRVMIEDALKHLYDTESKEQLATLDSVSGALGIDRDTAARLLVRLEELELVDSQRHGFSLTSEGRSYALRVIRIHRLWERYLADETGVKETDWHARAETLEHETSAAEADSLAAQLGNPMYDPHGDPIPTAAGEIPPTSGVPLTELAEDDSAQIVHLEDEPGEVYAQIVAEGLHLGMRLRVLEKTRERVRFIADGEEVLLAPVVAGNISVVPLEVEQPVDEARATLASLKLGETARVAALSSACRGAQRRRLMDLGIVPGTRITAELRSASGDPVAYTVRGATVALRKQQAGLIYIQPKEAA